ncbi:hypothetical protein OG889_15850 [Streptomyces sp. NBC_00481]|uniref:hypothetical protein n=1 Tax=unclassified Streptomyces TaxID=2593676 RepID=UPI002DD99588|nr:hypothetical protein [Streptomyces sp. NBC_00481]WRY96080.1 hypothetical protein OG889_15850 [Streptomyces sp. NBC_00481]
MDHWVILGTDEAPACWGAPVAYDPVMRHGLRDYLPDTVIGWHFDGTLPNRDFAISHTDLLSGDPERVARVRPRP